MLGRLDQEPGVAILEEKLIQNHMETLAAIILGRRCLYYWHVLFRIRYLLGWVWGAVFFEAETHVQTSYMTIVN